MFMDSRWEIWDNKALTADVSSFTAEGFFDMEENGTTDDSIGDTLWFNVQVGTAAADMASGAIISVVTSDAVDFSSGKTCLAALGSVWAPLLAADLTAKARFAIAFPRYTLKKYVCVNWDVISESASSLTVDAWFGLAPCTQTTRIQKAPSGYTM